VTTCIAWTKGDESYSYSTSSRKSEYGSPYSIANKYRVLPMLASSGEGICFLDSCLLECVFRIMLVWKSVCLPALFNQS